MRARSASSVLILAGALLGVTGCTNAAGGFEGELLRRADSGGSLELPPTVAGASWSELVLLCPYGSAPADADPGLAAAAEPIDTASDDGRQWLLFAAENRVETVIVQRSSIDFCGQGQEYSEVIRPDARWEGLRDGGVLHLSPSE